MPYCGCTRKSAVRPKLPIHPPHPWLVLLVSGLGAFAWLAMLSLLWRVQPAFAQWPLVLVPMLSVLVVAAMMVGLMRRWPQATGWSDRHLLALASGALIAHSVVGGMIFAHTTGDRISLIVLGVVMLLLLALFAVWIRRRGSGDRTSSAQGGAEPGTTGSVGNAVNNQQPHAQLNRKV